MSMSLLEKKPLKRKTLNVNQDEKFICDGFVPANICKHLVVQVMVFQSMIELQCENNPQF